VKIDSLAPLIRQANVREHVSDLWTSRSVIDVCAHVTANLGRVNCIPRRGHVEKTECHSMYV